MPLKPDPDARVDLDIALRASREFFEKEFVALWNLRGAAPPEDVTDEEWWELHRLHDLARRLAVATASLFRPSTLSNTELAEPEWLEQKEEEETARIEEMVRRAVETVEEGDRALVESELRSALPRDEAFRHRFFLTSFQIWSAGEFMPSLFKTARRQLDLVPFLTDVRRPTLNRYLARVARCYVWDLRPELAVMCRAVLEEAFRQRMPEEELRRALDRPGHRRITLGLWIDEATATGVLDEEESAAARRIRDRGSDAAHGRPVEHLDPWALVQDLRRLLAALVEEEGSGRKEQEGGEAREGGPE